MGLFRRNRRGSENRERDPADDTGTKKSGAGRWAQMFNALEVANFRLLWFGMLFSMAAIQMNVIARSWLAFDLTGSGLAIGMVAIARGVPRFVLSPIGGAAADRFDKRLVLILVQLVRGVLALLAAILVQLGVIEIWHLMIIGVVQGTTAPFTMPTRTAFISDLVGDEKLSNAIALDSTGRNLNRVLAPALAGVLLAIHPAIVFYVMAAFYICATVAILRLPNAGPPEPREESMLADIVFGFRYVWQNRVVLTLIGMVFFMVMLGMPYRQLLPVFQEEVLNVGPSALGLMYTAVGVGAIISSLAVAYLSESTRKWLLLLGTGFAFGASLIAFALTTSYLLALVLLGVVGFASQSYLTLNKTLVMLNTDRALYGRVMSIYMMGFAVMPAALLPMGAVIDRIGAPTTVSAVGLLLVAVVAIGAIVQITRAGSRTASAPSGDD